MAQGHCGPVNTACPRMQCADAPTHIPHKLQEDMSWCEGGYPHYRRREFVAGQNIMRSDGVRDNRWVVPYNPRLLKKYKCHLNVEICTSIKAVKYLYKYTYKGPDRANMEIINEVTDFLDARYVTAPEACWRLFEYPMHARSHVVERLPVHLHNEQLRTFEHGKETKAVDPSAAKDTKLMAYFKVSQARRAARAEEEELRRRQDEPNAACADELTPDNDPLKYTEIPNHYVWDGKNGQWVKRQRRAKGGEVIGRMFQCSPKNPELYALRLLLLHVPGIESYESLKHNGTFSDAAKLRGLMRNIDDVDQILTEMMDANCGVPKQCELFALILVWHDIGDARELWERNWPNIVAKSLLNNATEDNKINEHNNALRLVDDTLQHFRLDAKTYMLSYKAMEAPTPTTDRFVRECKEIQQERTYTAAEARHKFDEMAVLNEEQQTVFDDVAACVESSAPQYVNVFYVDGPAGSGKTCLYKKLIHHFRAK